MGRKDYSVNGRDTVPKLGPFASHTSRLNTQRRDRQARHIPTGRNLPLHYIGSTRKERQNVPFYAKPLRVQVPLTKPDPCNKSLLNTIRSGASSLYNRLLGRSQASQDFSDHECSTVLVRDDSMIVDFDERAFEHHTPYDGQI